MANPRWDLPTPNYEKDVNELKRIYRRGIQETILTLEDLATQGKSDKTISRSQMNSVLNQLGVSLAELDSEAEAWVREEINKAFKGGQAHALIALGEVGAMEKAAKMASKSRLARTSIEAMVADTFEDLLYANNKMKRESVKMVRNIVAEQMKVAAVQGQGLNFTKKSIVERFHEEGNIAIVDRMGRRWKLDTYSEMVSRTKMTQAHVEGTRVESLERGVDLAIISSHGATDACRFYEGQIISMNGDTPGYLTYEELRRSNLIFHPNCKHKLSPIRDIANLPEVVQDKFYDGAEMAEFQFKKRKKK